MSAHPAKDLVQRLVNRGYPPEQIASMLNQHVSSRTIYRWGAGASDPQNAAILEELRRLADALAPAHQAASK